MKRGKVKEKGKEDWLMARKRVKRKWRIGRVRGRIMEKRACVGGRINRGS